MFLYVLLILFLEGSVPDGLVLSCGYQTTHVIPVLEGRVVPGHAKRFVFIYPVKKC